MYSYQGAGHPRCVMHHIRHGPCARNTPHSNLSRPQPPRPRLRLRSSGQSPVLCMPKREAGKDWSETKRSHALLALASDTRLNQAIDIGSREGEASCHPPAKPRGKKQHSPPIPILHSSTQVARMEYDLSRPVRRHRLENCTEFLRKARSQRHLRGPGMHQGHLHPERTTI